MTSSTFRDQIGKALGDGRFKRAGKLHFHDEGQVLTAIGLQEEHGSQWFINVGFWMKLLGGRVPQRIESMHLQFRLERLFPDWRETILVAGDLADPRQVAALDQLAEELAGGISEELRELGTELGLRSALASGRLERGMLRSEARAYLSSSLPSLRQPRSRR
jgi:hypothetical protein